MELEELAKQCQNCAQHSPVIVLGSGASIPHGIRGMGDLAVWLRDNVQADDGPEVDAWTLVRTALAAGDHLEAALENKPLPDSLVVKIVRSTWDFIAQARQAWANLETQLRAADMGLDNIVKHTTFLSDRAHRAENSLVRKEVLGEREPALTVIVCDIFDESWLLEIEAIAVA